MFITIWTYVYIAYYYFEIYDSIDYLRAQSWSKLFVHMKYNIEI